MLPSSGSKARAIGAARYFTGLPCKFGHIEERYAHNGQCIGCARQASKDYRTKPEAKANSRAYYERARVEAPEVIMWRSARRRAQKFGVPFDIEPADILAAWPADNVCPVLGKTLRHNFDGKGSHADDSPSLDRMHPELGYVKGNIVVMSFLANRLKGDETDPEVFQRIAQWLMCVKGA